jgi:glyoxylase-like metal-dependent hydrolase (beta-lactamase superfamily II)
MKLGEPVDRRVPWIRNLLDLDEPRAVGVPGPRVEAIRRAARALGDELRAGPTAIGVKTMTLTTLPYPTRFAFNGTVPLPWPFITMVHRTLLVQVDTDEGRKNLLFNPTDIEAARATPFFARLTERVNRIAPFAERLLQKKFSTLEEQLSRIGIAPADIHALAFDHFHTQDLRPLLGVGGAPRFPNALLLAPRVEWNDWDGLHPLQRPWFVADGKAGVSLDRVVLTDRDLAIGRGCLLVRTPGHTTGNQTLFVHSDEGVFGCSENGTSADNWSPHASSIPGLRRYAEGYDAEVVLNSNTPELAAEQYTSMVLERSLVDSAAQRPEMAQMFPSSEVTPSPLAPGIRPALLFGHRDGGIFGGGAHAPARRSRTNASRRDAISEQAT